MKDLPLIPAREMLCSPLAIQILLNACVCAGPVKNYMAPAVREEVQRLIDLGAIERTPNSGDESWVQGMELGKAWLAALCSTPVPRVAYLDEVGREIQML